MAQQCRYGGDQRQRDAAYHQGWVWGWLIGPFISAHLRVYRDPVLARSYLMPLIRHMTDHGVGSISLWRNSAASLARDDSLYRNSGG